MSCLTRGLLAAGLLAMASPGAFADDEGDIKYRQAVMKGVAGHAGAIAQIAKGKVDHVDALEGHAHALLELSKMVPAAFRNQTSGESRAKDEIWSDRAGFEQKAGDLRDAAMALAEAAKSGPDAAKARLGDLFDTCKACHKEYRHKEPQ